MQQPSDAPISRRLRTIRRRIAAAVLATFIAAWLAVAALGKGGATPVVGSSQPPTAAARATTGPGAAGRRRVRRRARRGRRSDPGAASGYGDSGQSQRAVPPIR